MFQRLASVFFNSFSEVHDIFNFKGVPENYFLHCGIIKFGNFSHWRCSQYMSKIWSHFKNLQDNAAALKSWSNWKLNQHRHKKIQKVEWFKLIQAKFNINHPAHDQSNQSNQSKISKTRIQNNCKCLSCFYALFLKSVFFQKKTGRPERVKSGSYMYT